MISRKKIIHVEKILKFLHSRQKINVIVNLIVEMCHRKSLSGRLTVKGPKLVSLFKIRLDAMGWEGRPYLA